MSRPKRGRGCRHRDGSEVNRAMSRQRDRRCKGRRSSAALSGEAVNPGGDAAAAQSRPRWGRSSCRGRGRQGRLPGRTDRLRPAFGEVLRGAVGGPPSVAARARRAPGSPSHRVLRARPPPAASGADGRGEGGRRGPGCLWRGGDRRGSRTRWSVGRREAVRRPMRVEPTGFAGRVRGGQERRCQT